MMVFRLHHGQQPKDTTTAWYGTIPGGHHSVKIVSPKGTLKGKTPGKQTRRSADFYSCASNVFFTFTRFHVDRVFLCFHDGIGNLSAADRFVSKDGHDRNAFKATATALAQPRSKSLFVATAFEKTRTGIFRRGVVASVEGQDKHGFEGMGIVKFAVVTLELLGQFNERLLELLVIVFGVKRFFAFIVVDGGAVELDVLRKVETNTRSLPLAVLGLIEALDRQGRRD
eukprot:scaffold9946_cov188-Amphora_coffeaeformis.AAC.7